MKFVSMKKSLSFALEIDYNCTSLTDMCSFVKIHQKVLEKVIWDRPYVHSQVSWMADEPLAFIDHAPKNFDCAYLIILSSCLC